MKLLLQILMFSSPIFTFAQCVSGDCMSGDCKNGEGTMLWGYNKYVGEFKDGCFNGLGTLNDNFGGTYVGEWRDGNQHGQGTYTSRNGDTYIGEWKNGYENGLGTHIYTSYGEIVAKYVGEWKGGKEHGLGILILLPTVGDSYDSKYVGEWKDGKEDGLGIYTSSDGYVKNGLWNKGEFVGKFVE